MGIAFIKPSVEFWGQTPINPAKAKIFIERAGRVCYKSEEKITEGSANIFCDNIYSREHYSVLEHSNVVFYIGIEHFRWFMDSIPLERQKFLNFDIEEKGFYVGANLTSWIQTIMLLKGDSDLLKQFLLNGINDYFFIEESKVNNTGRLRLVADPDEIPVSIRMYTFKFITDRGVTHELVRHRPVSYSQESTRYVNYTGHMQFIIPPWTEVEPFVIDKTEKAFAGLIEGEVDGCDYLNERDYTWVAAMINLTDVYNSLRGKNGYFEQAVAERGGVDNPWPPQQARSVLPNSLKTEIVVTTTPPRWKHIQKLRGISKAAHPQIREIINPAMDMFKKVVIGYFD